MDMKWGFLLQFIVYFPSFVHAVETDYPLAELSSKWINNDLDSSRSTDFVDGSTVRIVLLNNSNPVNFPAIGCGFFGNKSTNSFFFVVFAVQATSDSTIVTTTSPQILWTANRANPVQENATLEFTKDGDLLLDDANGTRVWSTGTANKSINQMNVSGNGTLQLVEHYELESFSDIIWESSEFPTDTWLSGQRLVSGQTLVASISASTLKPGPFYLLLSENSLSAFIESNPPQLYHELLLNGTKTKQFRTGSLDAFIGRTSTSIRYVSETDKFYYLRLDPDGHLRSYQWEQGLVLPVDDILTDSLGNCAYPTVCGNYGVCANGNCSCPVGKDGDASYFIRLNVTPGCEETNQLSCQSSRLHTFIELEQVSYFTFVTHSSNIDVESCKQACLSNCSCKAALFRYNFNSLSGNCSLPSQIFSLMRIPQGLVPYSSASFIKVQKSLVAPRPPSVAAIPPSVAPSPHSSIPKPPKSASGTRRIVIILAVAFIIAMIAIFVWIRIKTTRARKFEEEEGRENNLYAELLHVRNLPKRFTYQELKSATDNFHKKLGGGGFGSVFEGTLRDGTKLAVKRLDQYGQGRKEFLAEVKSAGRIHHINLVTLLGFCAENSHRLLVYEYMSNGSLDKWIFNTTSENALEWKSKKNIILNVAKGLAYLHEDCEMKIAHLDVKPQNILLDDKFNAKLSDFGLARLIDRNQSQVITQMRGTRGYMAPEWLSRRITEKVDVYSFGIVILEIVCGRKNLDLTQREEDDYLLLPIVKQKAEENLLIDLVDKCGNDMQQQQVEEAVKMINVAIWCLHNDPARRPSMSMVLKVLEGVTLLEPISNFGFLTSTVVEAPADVVVVSSSPQQASTLSGPR